MYYKELYTKKPGGELPQLVIAENENLQSRFVVQKVLELREQGIPLEEMSILFRSSFHSFDLEIELTKANIPFVKYGGFKVLENPRDIVSWNRILLLVDGVGPRTAEKIMDDILASRLSTAGEGTPSHRFWSDYKGYPESVGVLFKTLIESADQKLPPADKTFRLLEYYSPILRARYDDHMKRKKDLEMFQNITERYKDVGTLLADLALEPPN